MPPIREHNAPPEPFDDDGEPAAPPAHARSRAKHAQADMPPLVENLNPNPPMTYTFLTDMTPLSFDAGSSSAAGARDFPPEPSSSYRTSPPTSPPTPDEALLAAWAPPPASTTRAHGKKRDASYIPRPPNAFILFRSSFIRSQQVPGKVEGNHSTLSKIIGKLWKALPREEKDEWEAKAVIAQAEHRRRYPDWRFRPGANAMAKLKVKDGTAPRRRSAQSRTKHPPAEEDDEGDPGGDKPKARDKGKGKARATREESLDDSRCTQIADLIGQGKTGENLEVAMREWEAQRKHTGERAGAPKDTKRDTGETTPPEGGKKKKQKLQQKEARDPSPSASRSPSITRASARSSPDAVEPDDTVHPPPSPHVTRATPHPTRRRSRTPDRSSRGSSSAGTLATLPSLPLTHMFKRSSSAPAPNSRLSYPPPMSSLGSVPDIDPRAPPSIPLSHELSTHGHSHGHDYVPPHPHSRGHHVPGHTRRDTVSFPMTPSDYPAPGTHLMWPAHAEEDEDEEEGRERFVSHAHGHGAHYWEWSDAGMSPSSMYAPPQHQQGQRREEERVHLVTTEGMGYEGTTGLSEFEPGFIEQLQEDVSSPRDGSTSTTGNNSSGRGINWGTNPGRLGLVTVIQDPFMQQKQDIDNPTNSTSPVLLPVPVPVLSSIPPTLSPPGMLSISVPPAAGPGPITPSTTTNAPTSSTTTNPDAFSFYPPHSPSTPATLPSSSFSSFSSLSGWAGDYHSPSGVAAGGIASPTGMTVSSSTSSAWYDVPGWEPPRHELAHPGLHIGPDEWEQMETHARVGDAFGRRAGGAAPPVATAVGTSRKVTFQDGVILHRAPEHAAVRADASGSAMYRFGRGSIGVTRDENHRRASRDHEMGDDAGSR